MLSSHQDNPHSKSEDTSEVAVEEQGESVEITGIGRSPSYAPPLNNNTRPNLNRQQILNLQHTIGNQAVMRLLAKPLALPAQTVQRSFSSESPRPHAWSVPSVPGGSPETPFRPTPAVIQRVLNDTELKGGLSQNKVKIINRLGLKAHVLSAYSPSDLPGLNGLGNLEFEKRISDSARSAGVSVAEAPKAEGTGPEKPVTTSAKKGSKKKNSVAAPGKKTSGTDDFNWDDFNPAKEEQRKKKAIEDAALAVVAAEKARLDKQAEKDKQARKTLLAKEARTIPAGILNQIEGDVVKISEIASAIFKATPTGLDPQELFNQGQALRIQLNDGKTQTSEFTDVARTWQVHIDAADVVLDYATALITKIGEITELRQQLKEKEAEVNSLQAEAANLYNFTQILALSKLELTRAEKDQVDALKLALSNPAPESGEGETEDSPLKIHISTDEISKKAAERVTAAQEKVKVDQAQYDKALAAKTSLDSKKPQKEVEDTTRQEKDKTSAGIQEAAKAKGDIELNQELLGLTKNLEALKDFRTSVSNGQDLLYYLTALGDSLLDACLKSPKVGLTRLAGLKNVFKPLELAGIKNSLENQAFIDCVAVYSPDRIHQLCNPSFFGLDNLAALIKEFGVAGTFKRTQETYVTPEALGILKNMTAQIGAAGVKRVENKLTLDQMSFWVTELKTDMFEVVDTLPQVKLDILIPKVKRLPPLINSVSRQSFLELSVELEGAALLKVVELEPARVKKLVDNFPVTKLAPVLNNPAVAVKGYTFGSLADLFDTKKLHVDKLKLADLTLLVTQVASLKLGDLLTLTPVELSKLLKLFENATGKDFGRLVDRPLAQLREQINDTTGRLNLGDWTAQPAINKFADLISERGLNNDVFEKYDVTFLRFFKGVGGDLFDHLTNGHVKSDDKISGAHTPASFNPLVSSLSGGWQNNVGTPTATYKKVRYGNSSGYIGVKTLILDLDTNYQDWKKRANEAIWESIRECRFDPASLYWKGTDDSGMDFEGLYNKSTNPTAVATWFPSI